MTDGQAVMQKCHTRRVASQVVSDMLGASDGSGKDGNYDDDDDDDDDGADERRNDNQAVNRRGWRWSRLQII